MSACRALALPPAPWISRTTSSSGGLRRPLTTTCAPSVASSLAVSRPMPLPPPVTIATCPSSLPITRYCSGARGPGHGLSQVRRGSVPFPPSGSCPGPDRLLEVSHPGRAAVHDDLTDLVEHGRGRCVNQRREELDLDDRSVALGDRDQAGDAGSVEIRERHPVDARDLGRIRGERHAGAAPHDHGGDDEAGARAVVVEQPEDRARVALEPDLLPELAERRALGALAGIDPAAGQRHRRPCPPNGRAPPGDGKHPRPPASSGGPPAAAPRPTPASSART